MRNAFPSLLFGLFIFSRISKSEGMTCDVEDAIKQHQKFREEKNPDYKRTNIIYKPSLGCGVCTRDVCIPNGKDKDSECKKMSALTEFEWETDIVEFGLLGNFLPKSGSVKVTLNKDFYLRIEIDIIQSNNLTALLKFCSLKGGKKEPECASKFFYYNFRNFKKEECLYLALGFLKNNKFQFGGTDKCKYVASTVFHANNIETPELPGFTFDTGKTMLISFHFDFEKDPSYTHKGVPVLLPCSQGGYAFDAETTRFLEGEMCWRGYTGSSKINGIPFIIEKYYGGNEDLYFDKLEGRAKYTPAYTDGSKMTLEKEAMLPKSKPNEKLSGKKRIVCDYVLPDAPVNKTKEVKIEEKPMNLEAIEALFGEDISDEDELTDDHFLDDKLIQDELEGLGDLGDNKDKMTTTTPEQPKATTPTASVGGGAGTGDTAGSTRCFDDQMINTVLKFMLMLQLLM